MKLSLSQSIPGYSLARSPFQDHCDASPAGRPVYLRMKLSRYRPLRSKKPLIRWVA